jgi:hypothetical protein
MLARRLGPGGAKAIIAESLLVKHRQLIAHRSAGKTPRLTTSDRFLCGFLALFMRPGRIRKAAVVIKPATLTKFRRALLSRNYQRLFSSRKHAKPGPKGPSEDLIRVIVELKQRNPRFGCPRIAQQINKTFGINIDKDVVRRVLAKHYNPAPYDSGPSWLTFLRHTRDSLSSIALPRRASILTNFHSMLLTINQFIRRMIGFGLSGCNCYQSEVYSLVDAAIPVVDVSKPLDPVHIPPSSHHRCRRKFWGEGRMQTVLLFPRPPPSAERWIRTRGRSQTECRSDCGVIECEPELRVFNDYCDLGFMPARLDEHRSATINRETALRHTEGQNLVSETCCREEHENLIAA